MYLKLDSRGEDVKTVQEALQQLGFQPGPIDGVFGEKTENAVTQFQEERPHSNRAQFHADHLITSLCQPDHVQAFATQGHEHPAAATVLRALPETRE